MKSFNQGGAPRQVLNITLSRVLMHKETACPLIHWGLCVFKWPRENSTGVFMSLDRSLPLWIETHVYDTETSISPLAY